MLLLGGLLVGACGGPSIRGGTLERDRARLRGKRLGVFVVERCLSKNAHPIWIERETVGLVEAHGKNFLVARRRHVSALRITNGVRTPTGLVYSVVLEGTHGDPILAQYTIPKSGNGTLSLATEWDEQERPGGFDVRPTDVTTQCELVRRERSKRRRRRRPQH